jgi:O-antigen ligase
LSDAVLQLLAIPILIVALWGLLDSPLNKSARATLGFCLAVAALPILQLLPLPPWFWTILPGRSSIAETYELIGGPLPWAPMSVDPEATWLSGLALIPPLAIFTSTLLVSYRDRRRLSLVVLSFGILSVFLGMMQVAQGPESPLRFYEFTNRYEAVGFFANRNHFAALTYSLILLAAAWTAHATFMAREANRDELHPSSIVAALASFTVILVLLVGESMARSRAGLSLTMMALLATVALVLLDRRALAMAGNSRSPFSRNKLFLGSLVLAFVLVVQFALYKIVGRLDDPFFGARIDFFRRTIEAAIAFMPFGSGLGTFVSVYALFEQPGDALANVYANHAHNEVLQIWLETGVIGIFLMATFAFWFVVQTNRIWRATPAGVRNIDWSLARAATIILALLAAHSLGDYPLHAGGMLAIAAFACGLMTEPVMQIIEKETPTRKRIGHRKEGSERRNIPSPTTAVSTPEASSSESTIQHTPWSADILWPQEWSTSSQEVHPKPGSPKADVEK